MIHKCSCGCNMQVYKCGMGPYVNLTVNTHAFIKYGLRGKHSKDCIFYGTDLRHDFDSPEEAINCWNKTFK